MFEKAKKEIVGAYPDAVVSGNERDPRTGAFEVTVGAKRKLVWSKLGKDGRFPPPGKLVQLLKDEGW